MRCMILIKATQVTEAGEMPDTEMLIAMGAFNEELVNAGIMVDGEGLHPTSKGARVTFLNGETSVANGPFPETDRLVAGFWIWQVESLDEAIEWVKRCPSPTGSKSEIEIRPLFEMSDFGDAMTPELQDAENRLRERVQSNQA